MRLRGDQIEVFMILNGYENIDRNMFFSLKKYSRTRGHEVKLVKDQCKLYIRKYSFSQRTINEWNKLSTDCVTASSMNMFKNKVDTYLRRESGLHVDEHCWTLDKPMASLSTSHLGLWLGWQSCSILFNLKNCLAHVLLFIHATVLVIICGSSTSPNNVVIEIMKNTQCHTNHFEYYLI